MGFVPVRFGKQDSVYKLVETHLQDEQGRPLWIADHVTSYYVFAGVYARDDGLVLTANTDEGYFPFPTAEEVKQYQSAGLFPAELPKHGLGFFDIFLGFSLWWLLLVVVVWTVISTKIEAKKEAQKPMEPEETTSPLAAEEEPDEKP